VHVYRLTEPIDDFDGLVPLHEWLDADAERVAWALQAVLALGRCVVAGVAADPGLCGRFGVGVGRVWPVR
jgi:hypothetical protein